MNPTPTRIAIIGAGLAGVTAGRELSTDFEVQVFEKSRGPGGRMASRRVEPYSFNHGAQFFTARSKEFAALVKSAQDCGVVTEWTPRLITLDPNAEPFKRSWFEPHYVGAPGMNSLAKFLATDLRVSRQCQIDEVARVDESWFLIDNSGAEYGPFDWVISSAPVSQTQSLLPESFNNLDKLKDVQFSPCFALMLGFSDAVDLGIEAAVIKNSSLAWAVASNNKTHSTLLVHSDNQWAAAHLEEDLEWVQQAMLAELAKVLPKPLPSLEHVQLHRWRFARCESPLAQTHLLDTVSGLGVCADWCGGNRVEDAFLSGMALAKQLKLTLLNINKD
jgi:renalase